MLSGHVLCSGLPRTQRQRLVLETLRPPLPYVACFLWPTRPCPQLKALEAQLNEDASCDVDGWLLLALHRLPRAGDSAAAVLNTVGVSFEHVSRVWWGLILQAMLLGGCGCYLALAGGDYSSSPPR